jgi:hypothetical protein
LQPVRPPNKNKSKTIQIHSEVIMNKIEPFKRQFAVSLACLALLLAVGSASALTITTANQAGTAGVYPFTPSWTPDSAHSLINGLTPSFTSGNFNLDNTNCNVNSLTSGGSLTINTTTANNPAGPDAVGNTTTSSNYVTCGNRTASPAAGNVIVYTLPASTFGYNVTNITVFSGWADNGRDSQSYSVLYSTVANTNSFNYLTSVNYRPTVANSTASSDQAIIDAGGATIVSNVVAVKFVFDVPTSKNSWTGFGAITVGGTPSASVASPVVSVTTTNESGPSPFTPDWTAETPNLIAGMAPSTASGNFTQEGAAGTNVLTDGTIGTSGNLSTFATVGNNGGNTLIYMLTNVVNGTDVTNIVVYSGWGNADRDGQYYTLSYSTIAAPSTYIPITTVYYNPTGVSGASANRVTIAMNNGSPLGSGVANLKFVFNTLPSAGSFDNGYQGFSEIIVQGHDTATPPPPPSPFLTQDTLPTHAETVVGDQIVFTAVYSNAPPANLQWQVIKSGVTNNITDATNTTLTLNNVQTNDSGSYLLKAVNATNGAAAPSYSTAAPLAVGTVTTSGNIIVKYAGQTAPTTGFYPAWTVDTNSDLIFGSVIGVNSTPGAGNFGVEAGLNGDPTILSDGMLSDAKALMVSCGWVNANPEPGQSMTYTLNTNSAPDGLELTNIALYGGWPDDGRNEQKYQILYSTVTSPSTFVPLITVDYNPSFSSGEPNATRTTLVPATGVLAHNVYAVEINFNFQSKNNWNGYSEITVNGTASSGFAPAVTKDITPLTAEDVVGSQVILTAAFTNATSYQWRKNGTNISGATTPTLTLSSLQLTDAGSYALLGINAQGTNTTRAGTVTIDPAPTSISNIVTAFAYQTSDVGAPNNFSPTWDTNALGSSLIAGQNPPSGGYDPIGNFNDPDLNPVSFNLAGGLPVLTDGNYGAFDTTGPHPAFATCGGGNGAGQYVIYTLGANANGYNVTNIQIAGGWNDNGRDSQYYTVSYSTVAYPTMFFRMVSVAKNLSSYGANDQTTVRTTITPATGVLASNVYAVEVDFTAPGGVPNGYSGYSEVSVFGSPSATPPPAGPVITTQHEETNFDWTVETPSLIANQLPSSQGPGVFTSEGCTEAGLTDGVLAFGGGPNSASCGSDTNASVSWIVFTPTNNGSWNLTNIVVYTLWHDYGRDGQFYNLSYSTVSAPTTFLPLASVSYDPFVPHDGRASGNRVAIAPPVGQTMLAANVAAVKFDFTPQGTQDFSWSGYTEIVLQGTSLIPPTFSTPRISGGNLILTGTGGTPGAGYTLLTTTNLSAPINWRTNTTGSLDGTGSFSNSVPISSPPPARFFRLRLP